MRQCNKEPHRKKKKANLEELMAQMAENTNKFMSKMRTTIQNQASQIRSMETQISQLANAQNVRPYGTLPSNMVVNPKDQCNAIILRGGKKLEDNKEKGETSDNKKSGVQVEPIVEPPTTKKEIPRVPYP